MMRWRPGSDVRHRFGNVLMVAVAVWAYLDAARTTVGAPTLNLIAIGVWTSALLARDRLPALLLLVPVTIAALAAATGVLPNGSITTMLVLIASAWLFGRRSTPGVAAAGALLWLGACVVLAPMFEPTVPMTISHVLYPAGYAWAALAAGVLVGRADTTARRLGAAADAVRDDLEQRRHRQLTEDRSRIARELNDLIVQSVGLMQIETSAARSALDAGDEAAATAALLAVEDTGRAAIQDLRRMLGVLRRDQREEQLEPTVGLAAAEQLVATSRATGMDVTLHVAGELGHVADSIDVAAARILQRLLELVQGSRATSVDIRVHVTSDRIELTMSHDGSSDEGFGPAALRERAALYGGTLEVGTGPEGGERFVVVLPIRQRARTLVTP
jgi:signal transduction histidine kinase